MSTTHLSEIQIQEYVANRLTANDLVIKHLQQCRFCSIQVANYQLLFEKLHAIEKPEFDFNLSALALENLPVRREKRPWLNYLAIAAMICLSLAVVAFFGDYMLAVFKGLPLTLFVTIALPALCILIFQATEIISVHKKTNETLNSIRQLQH
jgi:hypothetical protein